MKKLNGYIIAILLAVVCPLFVCGCSLFDRKPNPTEEINVVYITDGGVFSDGNGECAVSVPVGSKLTPPEDPERLGFVFSGWSTRQNRFDLKVDFDTYVAHKIDGDDPNSLKLYALWKPDSEDKLIEFDGKPVGNDAIVEIVAADVDAFSFVGKVVCSDGCTWTLEYNGTDIPSKAIVGLSAGDNYCTIIVHSPNDVRQNYYTVNIHRSHDVTISYKFGNTVLFSETVSSGVEYTVSSSVEVEGYDVLYWEKSGNRVDTFIPMSNTELSPRVDGKTYTVSFDTNGAEQVLDDKKVKYNDRFTLPNPNREGYFFIGWYNGNDFFGRAGDDSYFTLTENITLTARWSIIEYNIKAEAYTAGGSVSGSGSYEYGTDVTVTAVTDNGYTFIGWYASGTSFDALSYSPEYTFKARKDDRIVAKWSKCRITASANISGVVLPETSAYGEECTVRTTYPTLNGLTFDGWYSEYDPQTRLCADTEYTFVLEPHAAPKLIARWSGQGLDDFEIETTDGVNFEIKKIKNDKAADVVIPDYVTRVAPYICNENNYIVRLTIGRGVKFFGNSFELCPKLVEVRNLSSLDISNYSMTRTALNVVTDESTKLDFDYADGYIFYDDDKTYLVGYIGNETNLTLPNGYNGKPYEIYKYAFYGSDATNIEIAPKTTEIGNRAFGGCSNLAEVKYNADAIQGSSNISVRFYDSGAVGGITVKIGANVESIPAYLLYGNSKISAVYFEENSVCASIGESAFDNINIKHISIPRSVTEIKQGAFKCPALNTFDFEAADCNVEYDAFVGAGTSTDNGFTLNIGCFVARLPDNMLYAQDTPKVRNIVFAADGVISSIGENAVRGVAIESIAIPTTVTEICAGAFYGCGSLTRIDYNAVSCTIAETAFDNAGAFGLTAYIGGLVTKIPSNFGAPKLKKVEFYGNACTVIEANAFSDTELSDFDVPTFVTSIGNGAFRNCVGISNITLHGGIRAIGTGAFAGCGTLTVRFCAENIEEVGYMFDGSSVTLNIDGSVSNLRSNLFGSGIVKVVFDDDIESIAIAEKAFNQCENLTSIYIGGKNVVFAKNAFYDCTALTELTFDAVSAADTAGNVFVNASTAASVAIKIGKKATRIPSKLFYVADNADGESSITASGIEFAADGACAEIGEYAFAGLGNFTRLTIVKSITSIGTGAFSGTEATVLTFDASNCADFDDYMFKNCHVVIGPNVVRLPSKLANSGQTLQRKFLTLSVSNGAALECIGSHAVAGYKMVGMINAANLKKLEPYALSNVWIYVLSNDYFQPSLEEVGEHAFDGAYMTSIDLPNVKSLGPYAFANNNSLTDCYVSGTYAAIPVGCFYGCSELKSFNVPQSVVTIGENAFGGCGSLKSVVIDGYGGWKAGSKLLSYAETSNATTAAAYLTTDYVDAAWVRQ